MWRKFWDDFWKLNTAQRNASFVLLILLLILIVVNYFVTFYPKNTAVPLNSNLIHTIDSLEQLKQIQSTLKIDSINKSQPIVNESIVEIKKIESPTFAQIHINIIDSNFQHPLLYPALLQRIIKYRQVLGGFYKKEQVKEVYGLKETLYETLEPYLVIDTLNISKLPINTADFKAINKHPYIDYETTKLLVNARKKKKLSQADLKILLDNDLYLKLVPYISYE